MGATMSRIFNFSAGPAALPLEVLERVRAELLDWQGTGMSVMEHSHRGKEFVALAAKAEADLRTLLAIPDDYAVLFLQGGATLQFAQIPMNLAADGQSVDYLVTGSWSKKAAKEAAVVRPVNTVADGADSKYTDVPDRQGWKLDPSSAYLHYAANETIHGVEFHEPPDAGGLTLVADFSSTLLSRPIDVSRFGLIYAGAQKNIGPAGLTIVIVRKALLDKDIAGLPQIMNYAFQAENESMFNTPPTFAWYVAGLVFEWLLERGGLDAMAEINQRKARRLYQAIDESGFYANPVALPYRSWMNIPFTLADPALDADFLAESKAAGLAYLKGHRSVGGMRASIYNAMPEEGVSALIDFMADFERRRG
jgi:phosphoserine aminotransferase